MDHEPMRHGPPAEDDARRMIEQCRPFIVRQVRSLRRGRIDWSLRTSELAAEVTARMWKAVQAAPAPLEPAHFRALLARVGIVTFAQAVRVAVRLRARRAVLRAGLREGQAPDPAAEAALREEVQRLSESLTPEELSVWMLRAEGEPWDAIARRMDIAPGAARQRWSQVRTKVNRWIDEKAEEAT